MSEIGETFKALKEFNREKKQNNLEYATQHLIDINIQFESKNCGLHLIVNGNGYTVDYWPTTGLFNVRGVDYKGRGINTLVGIIKGTNVPNKIKRVINE